MIIVVDKEETIFQDFLSLLLEKCINAIILLRPKKKVFHVFVLVSLLKFLSFHQWLIEKKVLRFYFKCFWQIEWFLNLMQ